jgi:hypothetical protein
MLSLRLGTFVLILLVFLVAPVAAQDPNYQLSLQGPATLAPGEAFTARVALDNNGGDVAGWSYGVCHDPTALTLGAVSDGATTSTINQGGAPDFNNLNMFGDGFTVGVVVCFAACASLPAGTLDAELTLVDYTNLLVPPLEPAPGLTTSVSFCNTLNSPPISVVLTVNSNSIVPTQTNLDLLVPAEPLINPNYTLRLEGPALVGTGDALDFGIRLDNNGGDVAGWSYGVCYDDTRLGLDSVSDGTTTLTANLGGAADFIDNGVHPGGLTAGVVICFSACAFLPTGTLDADLSTAHFTVLSGPAFGDPAIDTTLAFCDTLGLPEIRTVVAVSSNSIVPTQLGAIVSIEGQPPTSFEYSVDPIPFRYFVPSNPVATPIEARLRIAQTGNDPAIPTQGFSMGMSHDPAMLTALAVNQGDALLAISPTGPEFMQTSILPDGWTAAVVYSLSTILTLGYVPSQEVLRVDYTTVATGFAGLTTFQNVPLTWSDAVGVPPVTNVVVISDGSGDLPTLTDGAIPMEPQFSGGYVRGDANGDGQILLTDVVWLLSDLFQGGPTTRTICFAANDMNNDGLVHLADPIFLLNYIFAAGTAPDAPFPDCGITSIPDCELPGFCAP